LFLATNPHNHIGRVIGNGHCVPFVQHVSRVPHTSQWRRGNLVRSGTTPSRTIIATFHPETGRYENDTTGRSHAAVFLDEVPNGLRVLDQWVGRPVGERVIQFRNRVGMWVNDGDRFYVVRTA